MWLHRQDVENLRAQRGKNIWMMGGAALIGAFVDQDQIDEFIIHVMPTLIGEGIPLLRPARREIQLSLRSCKHFSDGVVRLHYLVAKGTQGEAKGKQRAVQHGHGAGGATDAPRRQDINSVS